MSTSVSSRTLSFVAIVLWLTTAVTDHAQFPSAPLLLSDVAPPAIDRGLRVLDPPRDPRTDSHLASSQDRFLRGSIIVKLRAGTSRDARRAIVASIDGASATLPGDNAFDIVAIDAQADPEATARRVDLQPDVEYAQARYRVYPRFRPNDPQYSRQWNFPAIDMERAWDINPGATPAITVAVLDTGVAYRPAIVRYFGRAVPLIDGRGSVTLLPALGPVEIPFAAAPDLGTADRFVSPRDFIWDNDMPFDLDGHGTHVAGTIGQLTNNGVGGAGMAFNVRIMPVKVAGGVWDEIFGSPRVGTDDTVARGIRFAVDNGAKVVNMSVGREGPSAPVVRDAVAYAVLRGVFVAVSAGNDFEEGNDIERLAEFAPDIEGMVAVGAIGPDRQRAFYSNTGPYIELMAPGGNSRVRGAEGGVLQQTFDFDLVDTFLAGPTRYRAPRFDAFTYEFMQGTSMAAPHVAGFAALLMQQGVTAPAAVEAAMKRWATDLGAPGPDLEYGYGLINPRASLRGLGLAR